MEKMARKRVVVEQTPRIDKYLDCVGGILKDFDNAAGPNAVDVGVIPKEDMIKAVDYYLQGNEAEETLREYSGVISKALSEFPGEMGEELRKLYHHDAKRFYENIPEFMRAIVAWGRYDPETPSQGNYEKNHPKRVPILVAGVVDKVNLDYNFYGTSRNNHDDFRTSFWIPRESRFKEISFKAGDLDEKVMLCDIEAIFQSYSQRRLDMLNNNMDVYMRFANS